MRKALARLGAAGAVPSESTFRRTLQRLDADVFDDLAGLYAQLAALSWREVPVAYTKREHGHGRTERRILKVTSVAKGLAFPTPRRPSRSCAAAQ